MANVTSLSQISYAKTFAIFVITFGTFLSIVFLTVNSANRNEFQNYFDIVLPYIPIPDNEFPLSSTPEQFVEIVVGNNRRDQFPRVGFIVILNQFEFDVKLLEMANQSVWKYEKELLSIAVVFRIKVFTDDFLYGNTTNHLGHSKTKTFSNVMCKTDDFDWLFSLQHFDHRVTEQFDTWMSTFIKFMANGSNTNILLLTPLEEGTRLPIPGSIVRSKWMETLSMLNFIGAKYDKYNEICRHIRQCLASRKNLIFVTCLNQYLVEIENRSNLKFANLSQFIGKVDEMSEVGLNNKMQIAKLRSDSADRIVKRIKHGYFLPMGALLNNQSDDNLPMQVCPNLFDQSIIKSYYPSVFSLYL